MTSPRDEVCVSSSDVAPTTSTVSVNPPACSVTPVRTNFRKPLLSTVTEYSPGRRLGMTYAPDSSVSVLMLMLVCTFVTVTVALGTMAPDSSRTRPVMVAVSCWAHANEGHRQTHVARRRASGWRLDITGLLTAVMLHATPVFELRGNVFLPARRAHRGRVTATLRPGVRAVKFVVTEEAGSWKPAAGSLAFLRENRVDVRGDETRQVVGRTIESKDLAKARAADRQIPSRSGLRSEEIGRASCRERV